MMIATLSSSSARPLHPQAGRFLGTGRSGSPLRPARRWAGGGMPDGRRRGLTLLELILVVAVLAVLAGTVVPLLHDSMETAQDSGVRAGLTQLRDAVMGRGDDPGFHGDLRRLPTTLAELWVNPDTDPGPGVAPKYPAYDITTRVGWHGPYLRQPSGSYAVNLPAGFTLDYGAPGDPAVLDSWGRPIVLQRPTVGTAAERELYSRLVSAGFDGILQTPAGVLYPTAAERGDDVLMFLKRADVPP
jgi:prepilin-type N-terminal cleavage/methylation domain-containing protein